MSDLNLKEALFRYFNGKASVEEEDMLMYLMNQENRKEEVEAVMEEVWTQYQATSGIISAEKGKDIVEQILNQKQTPTISRRNVFPFRFRWAAAILIIISCSILVWQQWKPSPQEGYTNLADNPNHDVQPGREGAILTLSDGTHIELDTIRSGIINSEIGTALEVSEGKLAYNLTNFDSNRLNSAQVQWHTLTTPKGRQFSLELPDGTKLWLNAASSIRFPIAFTGKERTVELTGEAYFEVTPSPDQPFIVITRQQQVKVLGTHFNINAYDDEDAEKTTLLEGSVQVSGWGHDDVNTGFQARQKNILLKPGQQLTVAAGAGGSKTDVTTVDLDQVIAWKNGVFNFHRQSLQSAMRQISRWYGVEIVYEKNIPEVQFGGKVQRNLQLSQIIKGLADEEVSFRIEGNKLIVSH